MRATIVGRACRRLNVYRRARFIVTSFESSSEQMEHVTPIVLIANKASAISHCAFRTFASALSREGYSGFVLERSHVLGASCVDDAVSRLHEAIHEAGIMPPILIASNFTAYLAQKYLESYPLKGLIMLDPPSPCIAEDCTQLRSNENSILCQSILLSDERSRIVNLEKGCVPMMLVSTSDRRSTARAVVSLHGIAEEDVMLIDRSELHHTENIANNIDSALLADHRVHCALLRWIDLWG